MKKEELNDKENTNKTQEGAVEKVYLQEDGTIRREVAKVEEEVNVRTERGPTGTWGAGDRTDRDGWLSAGMADDEQSRNPEGFFKDKDRSDMPKGARNDNDE